MRRYADIGTTQELTELAELAKAIADPRRIAMLQLLADGKEHCVCHLATSLEMPEFQVSRHLAPLRRLGLVSARREGTWMHYHACASACASALQGLASALSPKALATPTGGSGEACCLAARGRVRSAASKVSPLAINTTSHRKHP